MPALFAVWTEAGASRHVANAKSSAERVREARDKLRAAGLRPVQIWIPDTTAPGFAAEAARQARLLADWEASPGGREEMAFWDVLAAEAWDDEPE